MAKRSASKTVSPRLAVGVIGSLVALIVLVLVLLGQANFLVGRSLLIAFGNGADSTYKGARFAWNGDLVARDFSTLPVTGRLLAQHLSADAECPFPTNE